MTLQSKFVDNNGVRLHYLDSEGTSSEVPLFISPGLSERAEEYEELIAYLAPRRCVVLSYRGRGKSETPFAGYGLKEHVSDLDSVAQAAGLHLFHLYAYSRGVSYALGYLQQNSEKVASILLQDYPPEHKAMTEDWAENYIGNYLIPNKRTGHIRSEAVWGIQRESEQIHFDFTMDKKMLLLRGLQEGSLLSELDVDRYIKRASNATVVGFEHSAHDIRSVEKELLFQTIKNFLQK
ncbi:alpha/beta fold hydrolase [Paenibacillus sp. GCM10027627]|uniref:alpha/beta fold hydrolase n=1 Tax=unclassified Paenibacillus TaxID=185978 RepID=UPI003631A383